MALLVLIPLLGYILVWRRLMQSNSASAALHAPSVILLVLYAGSLAGMLLPVTKLLLVVGVLLAVYELLLLVKNDARLPLPLGVFVILCGLFWLLHHDGVYAYYDEYSHWGILLKEMLVSDAFWGSDSNATSLRYLPGPPLWQYLFLAVTEVSEGGAFLAQFCLLLLPLVVLWHRIEWRQFGWILGILALVALSLSNFGHGVASLYVDHVIGAWFAGTIFNFLLDMKDRSPWKLATYLLPLSTLVLLKDAGLFFAAAAIGIMALLLMWRGAFVGHDRSVRNGFITASTLAVIWLAGPILITASWNANRNIIGIPSTTVSFGGIVSGITSGKSNLTSDEQDELQSRIREVVIHHQISKDEISAMYNAFSYPIMSDFTDRFRLTTASSIFLFALWQIVVLRRFAHPDGRWQWAIVGSGLILTAIFYLVVLSLSYRFAFDQRGLSLSSFVRYAHTALLPMLLFFFLPLLPGFWRTTDKSFDLPNGMQLSQSAAVFTVLLTALYVFETPYLTPLYKQHESPPVRLQFDQPTAKLRELVGDSRLWIYLPVPDSSDQVGRIITYQMTPVRTEVVVDPGFLTEGPGALQDVVDNWDYLWFPAQQSGLDGKLRFLFGEDLGDRVFRVDRANGDINIVALNGVFD